MQRSELAGEHIARIFVPGQATAGTPDDWTLLVAEYNITIVSIKLIPNAAITANGTNYFTLTATNKGAAAGGSTAVATRSWAATNSSAFVSETMTNSSTASDLNMASGDVLDLARTVAASGLAMPDMLVQVAYKTR